MNRKERFLFCWKETSKNCQNLARELTRFNEERKGIEAQLTSDALLQVEQKFKDEPAVVVTGKGNAWHPGVVGIVAGKLANSLNKPCLVLARSDDGEYCGSGRGIHGINLVEILSECQKNLSHWGHPIAVGLGVKEEKLDDFITQFLSAVEKSSSVKKEDPNISIDAVVKKKNLPKNYLRK